MVIVAKPAKIIDAEHKAEPWLATLARSCVMRAFHKNLPKILQDANAENGKPLNCST